jgi:ribonuclease HII
VVRVRAFRTIENAIRREGYACVAGVDEVGRGCLAGPVVAGAVALNPGKYVPRIADSKTVTALERERLFDRIIRAAVCWCVSVVDAEEIDRLNIHKASLAAMERAVMGMTPLPDFVLVDAFKIPNIPMAQRAVVHGDARCTAIAAASILAKVTRDRLMREMHEQYPHYGLDKHKGYATKEHLDAVIAHGYSAVHRKSFHRQRQLFVEGVVGTCEEVGTVISVDGGDVTTSTEPTRHTDHLNHPSNVPTSPPHGSDDGL